MAHGVGHRLRLLGGAGPGEVLGVRATQRALEPYIEEVGQFRIVYVVVVRWIRNDSVKRAIRQPCTPGIASEHHALLCYRGTCRDHVRRTRDAAGHCARHARPYAHFWVVPRHGQGLPAEHAVDGVLAVVPPSQGVAESRCSIHEQRHVCGHGDASGVGCVRRQGSEVANGRGERQKGEHLPGREEGAERRKAVGDADTSRHAVLDRLVGHGEARARTEVIYPPPDGFVVGHEPGVVVGGEVYLPFLPGRVQAMAIICWPMRPAQPSAFT